MKAYVTLLSTDNYYLGVVVLNKSLNSVGSAYPLICALSQSVSGPIENKLIEQGIRCVRLNSSLSRESVSNNHNSNWNFSFDKLQVWGLTEYEKLVYVDSDMLVISNIDSLFDSDPFSGVCAGRLFPGNEKWEGINSGLMVIQPSKDVMNDLLSLLPKVIEEYELKRQPVGDQDVIQRYISKLWSTNHNLHLDEGYNLFADFLSYYIRNLNYSIDANQTRKRTVYIIHFIGKYKPWMKPTLRESLWIGRMLLSNPYYIQVLRRYREFVKN